MEKIFKIFSPSSFAESIFDIDFVGLKARGIKGVLFDLDNTLVPRGERVASEELKIWIKTVLALGIKICIISNNWTARGKAIADALGVPLVAKALKPRRRAFYQALHILGTKPSETAVVGDQLFTDILGGNRLNLYTILVPPTSSSDMVHTKVLRVLERLILKRIKARWQMSA